MNSDDRKGEAASQVKSCPSSWLHRVDEFRNCFLYENIFETNPQFQAVEIAKTTSTNLAYRGLRFNCLAYFGYLRTKSRFVLNGIQEAGV